MLVTLSPTLSAQRPWRINTIAGSGNAKLQGNAEGPSDVLATEVNLNQTFGVEVDGMGNLYICEVGHHRLWKLDYRSGRMRTIAGTGEPGHEGDGGPALKATLNEPYEVRLDSRGNIYLVDMVGAVVRRIDAHSGVISTIAGTAVPGFSGDGGPALAAQLRQPHSIALDDQGGLYIADIGNHRIRKVDLTTGVIETIAGTGERKLPESGKPAKGQPISGPRALHVKGGFMWIALR